jgi:very-short-patch-repair endonuclease
MAVLSVEEGRALLRAGKAAPARKRTALYELTLVQQIVLAKLPAPVLEHPGIPGRKFRFDLAWPDRHVALEIDGAVWINGRHSRGSGVQKDCEKFSLAAIYGWRVMRVTPDQVKSGKALRWLGLALRASGATP